MFLTQEEVPGHTGNGDSRTGSDFSKDQSPIIRSDALHHTHTHSKQCVILTVFHVCVLVSVQDRRERTRAVASRLLDVVLDLEEAHLSFKSRETDESSSLIMSS